MPRNNLARRVVLAAVALALTCAAPVLSRRTSVSADGRVMPPRDYNGSLEELAQEALIIFHDSDRPGGAVEDLILKISVQSTGEVRNFGWVVPFPQEPTVAKEDQALFKELFDYVAARTRPAFKNSGRGGLEAGAPAQADDVTVLSRKIVGTYDVAIVRENVAGSLDQWLAKEGFQTMGRDAEDVIGFYRRKGYVFACIKVSDTAMAEERTVDLHPLRFTFRTGGCDGIYFPMKMTGLQRQPFDVNLYVFYQAWLNDRISRHGYVHRGFSLKHRDWDTPQCQPNGGKAFSAPDTDVYLRGLAHRIPAVTKLFQTLHPGSRYYLTNIQARGLRPADVRQWADDLWLFPYYSDAAFVPVDARAGGVASAAYVAQLSR
ncbi:MAG: DUF2330 domain-containing protein [Planctomycetota bacterium]|nr:DUF2330 domain-containing protein [Planctomycetota bacterium]